MKKKLAIIVSLLICFCFVLSGCTLFEKNLSKYYNTTVVSIEYADGETININKKELIIAFNNYGAEMINKGFDYEEAMDKTITALINQKVLLKDGEDKITLTNLDKNNVWKDTYNSIFVNLEDYILDIKKEWNITIAEEVENEEQTTTAYKPYEPSAKVVYENGKYTIKLIEEVQEDENQALIYNSEDIDKIVISIYNSVMSKTEINDEMTDYEKQTARVNKEALNRYIKFLLVNEEGQRLSTKNDEVLKREIKRIYENTLNSVKITKMQEYISSTSLSKITVNDVLDKYKSMILSSMTKYSVDEKVLNDDMLSSFSNVNYTPNDDYFFVSHILLKFSEEQQKEYDELKSLRNKGFISQEYYQQRTDSLVQQIVAVEKDEEGNIVESSNKSAEQVLNEINNALTNAVTDTAKNEAFKQLLYKYNQDDGALNSEYLYVIGENDSKMVESFTDASRELNQAGVYGAVSGLVPSQYGVHIIYYAGKVQNAFNFSNEDDVNFTQEDIQVLTQTLINPLNNKTLFDKVYESLTASESSANEALYLNVIKKDLKITKYKSAYKDLLD